MQAACDLARVHLRVDAPLPRLVRRDLRHVEDIPDVQAVARDLNSCEVIDREVAERVCLCCDRNEQRDRNDDQYDEPLHEVTPFRATGAHRIEKWGFSASARR